MPDLECAIGALLSSGAAKARKSAIWQARPQRAQVAAMLTATKRTIRLTPAQDKALRSLADRRGLSPYRTRWMAIDAGLGTIAGSADHPSDTREIAEEVGVIAGRLVELERVLDRSLFVACAAYAYARNAALATRQSDETIAAEARAAFERQRSLAMGDRS